MRVYRRYYSKTGKVSAARKRLGKKLGIPSAREATTNLLYQRWRQEVGKERRLRPSAYLAKLLSDTALMERYWQDWVQIPGEARRGIRFSEYVYARLAADGLYQRRWIRKQKKGV